MYIIVIILWFLARDCPCLVIYCGRILRVRASNVPFLNVIYLLFMCNNFHSETSQGTVVHILNKN